MPGRCPEWIRRVAGTNESMAQLDAAEKHFPGHEERADRGFFKYIFPWGPANNRKARAYFCGWSRVTSVAAADDPTPIRAGHRPCEGNSSKCNDFHEFPSQGRCPARIGVGS